MYVFINLLQPLARHSKRSGSNEDDGCDRMTLQRCYWFVYGALLKQGSTLEPRSGKYLAYYVVTGTWRIANSLVLLSLTVQVSHINLNDNAFFVQLNYK